MKRFCQYLKLPADPQLREQYKLEHSRVWPEVQKGILSVGILDMQIHVFDQHAFMIMDTTDDFDWTADNAKLSTLPRQTEWEAFMAPLQGASPDSPSTEKWQLMDKIFELDKSLK